MKKKDKKLFDKSIHLVKQVIAEIAEERTKYHENITKLRLEQQAMRKKHDSAVKKQIKELLEVVDEMYILFEDLTDEKGR